jgi:pimeloyl-ACP methyl ester carboxylesterase
MQSTEGHITTDDGVRLLFKKLGADPRTPVIIPNAAHMFDSFRHLAEHRTVIFFDLRNRGGSDSVSDRSKLTGGIHHDVDDMEAVRRHFGLEKVDLIGHSYLGLMVILYAMKYPDRVNRVVQIGPAQPNAATQYPANLTGADPTLAALPGKLAQLRTAGPPANPKEACEKFWAVLREGMVANPEDAGKINWSPCDYPNELLFMKHWTENIFPSIQSLRLSLEELSKVSVPVLTIHGDKDRQASYGAGREWASILPNARLVTVEGAAHVPWIEAPEKVFSSIETFLDGAWPESAEPVASMEPIDFRAHTE